MEYKNININKNIYFICRGVSCNDIIESIKKKNTPNEKKSFFNFIKKNDDLFKIKEEEFSRLDTIGINELLIMYESEINRDILFNNSVVFTSLDYSAIESGLVIYKNNSDKIIYPIPNISKNTGLKDKKKLDILKKKFGSETNEKMRQKYWDEKKVYSVFPLLKEGVPKIDWKYTKKYDINSKIKNIEVSTSELNSYSFEKFKKFLSRIISFYKNIKNKNIIFICSPKLILDILKNIQKKNTKYNEKTDIIEYSSIWKIDVSLNIDKDIIKFNYFDKVYPTEYNHPLKLNYSSNDKYSYIFENKKYILFNSLKPIPITYLKKMNFRCIDDRKEIMNILLKENIKDKEEEYKEENNNKKKEIRKNDIYEQIMENINLKK